MSRNLLVVIKCNNNKDIVRGIYNPKNSELKESKFNALQLADLQDETKKVLSNISGYKTIKFAWIVSNKNGEIANDNYTMTSSCYCDDSMINHVIPKYFTNVNRL